MAVIFALPYQGDNRVDMRVLRWPRIDDRTIRAVRHPHDIGLRAGEGIGAGIPREQAGDERLHHLMLGMRSVCRAMGFIRPMWQVRPPIAIGGAALAGA